MTRPVIYRGNFTAVNTGNFTGNTAGHFPVPGNGRSRIPGPGAPVASLEPIRWIYHDWELAPCGNSASLAASRGAGVVVITFQRGFGGAKTSCTARTCGELDLGYFAKNGAWPPRSVFLTPDARLLRLA